MYCFYDAAKRCFPESLCASGQFRVGFENCTNDSTDTVASHISLACLDQFSSDIPKEEVQVAEENDQF